MDYCSLDEMISHLEYGTKLHIGVLFFGNFGGGLLTLPLKKTIHASPVCDVMKSLPGGYRRCYYCRNAAIRRAITALKPFSGLCINGILEYTRPVVLDGKPVCMIFIGNILPPSGQRSRMHRRLAGNEALFSTLETDFSPQRCEALGRLIESYIRLLLQANPPVLRADYDPLTENLKRYIEDNLEYRIDLALLAGMFHYNEKYLARLFKGKTGMSLGEYANQCRISRAKSLLTATDDSILSIAARCGFGNVTYFNRVFRAHSGVTPTEFRQKSKQEG